MKKISFVFFFSLFALGHSQARTWERCHMWATDGSTFQLVSNLHGTYEKNYNIKYTIKGKFEHSDQISVEVNKNNNEINYNDIDKNFNLFIKISSCLSGSCSGTAELKTSMGDIEFNQIQCNFNIYYVPASGSGGRCGGRRC